mmetsp:Transcript_58117/g.168711  ORF Transcript_58117/g.168711 Transcript_58117/m.168711 type:complete len:346 (+) Transcript_58117:1888-2925(+)
MHRLSAVCTWGPEKTFKGGAEADDVEVASLRKASQEQLQGLAGSTDANTGHGAAPVNEEHKLLFPRRVNSSRPTTRIAPADCLQATGDQVAWVQLGEYRRGSAFLARLRPTLALEGSREGDIQHDLRKGHRRQRHPRQSLRRVIELGRAHEGRMGGRSDADHRARHEKAGMQIERSTPGPLGGQVHAVKLLLCFWLMRSGRCCQRVAAANDCGEREAEGGVALVLKLHGEINRDDRLSVRRKPPELDEHYISATSLQDARRVVGGDGVVELLPGACFRKRPPVESHAADVRAKAGDNDRGKHGEGVGHLQGCVAVVAKDLCYRHPGGDVDGNHFDGHVLEGDLLA